MKKLAFDNSLYLKIQRCEINKRIALFGDKLYLEFGGKLFDDYHASRVLPGFKKDSKLKMLLGLKDKAEVVIPSLNDYTKISMILSSIIDTIKEMKIRKGELP